MGRDNMQGIAPGAPAGPSPLPRDRYAAQRTDIFAVGAVELGSYANEKYLPSKSPKRSCHGKPILIRICTLSAR